MLSQEKGMLKRAIIGQEKPDQFLYENQPIEKDFQHHIEDVNFSAHMKKWNLTSLLGELLISTDGKQLNLESKVKVNSEWDFLKFLLDK